MEFDCQSPLLTEIKLKPLPAEDGAHLRSRLLERELQWEKRKGQFAGIASRERQLREASAAIETMFTNKIVEELAEDLNVEKLERTRFAQSVRVDARLFLESKTRLNASQLRSEVQELFAINNRAKRGNDMQIKRLVRAVDAASSDVWDWLLGFGIPGGIPTPTEIHDPATRGAAIQQLNRLLSYGRSRGDGRKRKRTQNPTGRSKQLQPLLRAPTKIARHRPKSAAERDFVRNLSITYQEATGKNAIHD